MALTEFQIKNAAPRAKKFKLSDGHGLILIINPNDRKYWAYRYRVPGPAGKPIEKTLALGVWPEVTLKAAREKCRSARMSKDPAQEKKAEKKRAIFGAVNTFSALAREWYDTNLPKWTLRHAKKLWRRIELHLLPELGLRPVSEISPLELLQTIKVLEKSNKTETTHKLLQDATAIFQYAVLTQRIAFNPARELKGGLRPHLATNLPSIDPKELPAFIAKLKEVKTTELNRMAVKLLMLTFLRTGELRKGKKAQIDQESKLWEVDTSTMKMRRPHSVPLSSQALAVLAQLNILTGDSEYLFPAQQRQKNPIMSENTINNVIHEMGYKSIMVGHGFRALASTILNKNGFNEAAIELQLAHAPRNKTKAAYNRYKYLEERRVMMQWWGDYLEKAGLVSGL